MGLNRRPDIRRGCGQAGARAGFVVFGGVVTVQPRDILSRIREEFIVCLNGWHPCAWGIFMDNECVCVRVRVCVCLFVCVSVCNKHDKT